MNKYVYTKDEWLWGGGGEICFYAKKILLMVNGL
jgi:hypothetical protein